LSLVLSLLEGRFALRSGREEGWVGRVGVGVGVGVGVRVGMEWMV
jgi:hypothetical protein